MISFGGSSLLSTLLCLGIAAERERTEFVTGRSLTFFMAGGGTGGHVIPAIAVARELQARGHQPVFIGTQTGFEAKLVPAAGFPLELIEIGGLNRVGMAQTFRTLRQLPFSLTQSAGPVRPLSALRPFSAWAAMSPGRWCWPPGGGGLP